MPAVQSQCSPCSATNGSPRLSRSAHVSISSFQSSIHPSRPVPNILTSTLASHCHCRRRHDIPLICTQLSSQYNRLLSPAAPDHRHRPPTGAPGGAPGLNLESRIRILKSPTSLDLEASAPPAVTTTATRLASHLSLWSPRSLSTRTESTFSSGGEFSFRALCPVPDCCCAVSLCSPPSTCHDGPQC